MPTHRTMPRAAVLSLQAVRRREVRALRRFDYGSQCADAEGVEQACNQRVYTAHYGQGHTSQDVSQPPAYNLSNIATPLALFSGMRYAKHAAASMQAACTVPARAGGGTCLQGHAEAACRAH